MGQPPIDLRPADWVIVRDILARFVPDYDVLAFGSRARRDAKRYSDLDLALRGTGPLPATRMSALREAFGDSDLPFKVDIADLARAEPNFRAAVLRDAIQIQVAADDPALFARGAATTPPGPQARH